MAISVLNKHPYSNINLKQAQWTALTKWSHLTSLDFSANQTEGQRLPIIWKPLSPGTSRPGRESVGADSWREELTMPNVKEICLFPFFLRTWCFEVLSQPWCILFTVLLWRSTDLFLILLFILSFAITAPSITAAPKNHWTVLFSWDPRETPWIIFPFYWQGIGKVKNEAVWPKVLPRGKDK